MKVLLILGARPQIIKSAPIIHKASECSEIELLIVHTGQHYDYEMSKIFFNELDLPDPVVNLGVGSGTHAWQTGTMLVKLEDTINDLKPDLMIVPGDTNSTLAGALAAAKLNIPLFHMEAGTRSYDMMMPEEVNRRLTDQCSDVLFAVTENCVLNLKKENVPGKIYLTGDTMLDAFLNHFSEALENDILNKLDISPKAYAVLTLHRPANVDNPYALKSILEAITELKEITILFIAHPRTMNQLRSTGLRRKINGTENIRLLEPVGYHEMLKLLAHARVLLTDSGGLQKEAFWAGAPCLTLRENTEWVETVQVGMNVLVGSNTDRIVHAARKLLEKDVTKEYATNCKNNPFGDGKSCERIIQIIRRSKSSVVHV